MQIESVCILWFIPMYQSGMGQATKIWAWPDQNQSETTSNSSVGVIGTQVLKPSFAASHYVY